MSDQATIFELPYNLFLMQRMEFVVACGDHLAANVMRVIEAEMIKRKEAWQFRVEKAIENKQPLPKEPKTWWVRLSQSQILARLYMYDSAKLKKPESEDLKSPEWVEYRYKKALSISKATLKKAIELLKALGFLIERSKPGDEFGAPIYTLHTVNVQKAMKSLPTNPFTIFHHLGGVENIETGGESKIFNVPPKNSDSGESQNLEVPPTEIECPQVQNFHVDIDSSIDTLLDNEIEENVYSDPETEQPSDASATANADRTHTPNQIALSEDWLAREHAPKEAHEQHNHNNSYSAADSGHHPARNTAQDRVASAQEPHTALGEAHTANGADARQQVVKTRSWDSADGQTNYVGKLWPDGSVTPDYEHAESTPVEPSQGTTKARSAQHARWQQQLPSMLTEEGLSSAEQRALHAHLAECAECAQLDQQRQAILTAIREQAAPKAQLSTSQQSSPQRGAKVAPKATESVVKQPTSRKSSKPAPPEFTAEGQKVYDAWCSLFKSPPRAAEKTVTCANALYPLLVPWCKDLNVKCATLLDEIQKWMYETDKTGWYKRGITLCDIERDFEKWQSAKTREGARPKPEDSPLRKLINRKRLILEEIEDDEETA